MKSILADHRVEVEHLLRSVDGRLIAARSSLVSGTGANGRPTVFGITVFGLTVASADGGHGRP